MTPHIVWTTRLDAILKTVVPLVNWDIHIKNMNIPTHLYWEAVASLMKRCGTEVKIVSQLGELSHAPVRERYESYGTAKEVNLQELAEALNQDPLFVDHFLEMIKRVVSEALEAPDADFYTEKETQPAVGSIEAGPSAEQPMDPEEIVPTGDISFGQDEYGKYEVEMVWIGGVYQEDPRPGAKEYAPW